MWSTFKNSSTYRRVRRPQRRRQHKARQYRGDAAARAGANESISGRVVQRRNARNPRLNTNTGANRFVDQRRHPHIRVPLLVEAQHPAFGKENCTVRDISESGLYMEYTHPSLAIGAKLKVRQLPTNALEAKNTPTVEVAVRHLDSTGMGVEFLSSTGTHLWHSVTRGRDQLTVGRDVFQIYHSAVLQDDEKQLLVVRRHGVWGFPGRFMSVGDDFAAEMSHHCEAALGCAVALNDVAGQQVDYHEAVPEAAIYRVAFFGRCAARPDKLVTAAWYREMRWLANLSQVKGLTFASDFDRQLATRALDGH